jgi:hypothetical protein
MPPLLERLLTLNAREIAALPPRALAAVRRAIDALPAAERSRIIDQLVRRVLSERASSSAPSRRPRRPTASWIDTARQLRADGLTVTAISRSISVNEGSIYRALRQPRAAGRDDP